MSLLTLNRTSSSVSGGMVPLYSGCANSLARSALSPLGPGGGAGRRCPGSRSSGRCAGSRGRGAPGCRPRGACSAGSAAGGSFSNEWDVRLEAGSELKSWRMRSVCLLGQPASPAAEAAAGGSPGRPRGWAQPGAFASAGCAQEHPGSPGSRAARRSSRAAGPARCAARRPAGTP